jgi:hypothetical protein
MAWIKINQPLREGQFIRLNVQIMKSSFSKGTSATNAAYSLMYGNLHDFQRNDACIKANSVGQIISQFDSLDGSYLVKFENVTRLTANDKNPAYFFDGTGQKVKMMKKELFEKADVWVR